METSSKNPLKPEDALRPEAARIDLIGLVSKSEAIAFNNIFDFKVWLELNPQAKFVGHNLKFDFRHIRRNIPEFDKAFWHGDTLLMAHTFKDKVPDSYILQYEERRSILNEKGAKHRKAGKLSLKVLAPYFLSTEAFWEEETYNSVNYVLKDSFYTLLLYAYFLQHMSPQEMAFYHNKSLNWSLMLLEAEERGIKISQERLLSLEEKLKTKVQALDKELHGQWAEANKEWFKINRDEVINKYEKMGRNKSWEKRRENALAKVPTRLDFNSPAQVKWLLRDYYGLDVTTFEGDESTGKEVLETLAKSGRNDVAKLLEYRKANKILTAFIPSYKELADNNSVIHTSFHVAGTRTGRLSSSDPNMQQVSKDLKHLFIPRPGYKFINFDLAAIEARLIAWYADDEALCNILKNGWSIHDFNAKVFFKLECPVEEVKKLYPKERAAAKTVGFALIYGAGPGRIRAAFAAAGFMVTKEQARTLYDNYKKAYKGAFDFHKYITEVLENDEVVLNALGRPIRITEDENAYMQGFNRLVQSSASDINLDAAYKTSVQWYFEGIDAHILLLIHDAILAEVKEDQVEKAFNILKSNMENRSLKTVYGSFNTEAEGGIDDEWR